MNLRSNVNETSQPETPPSDSRPSLQELDGILQALTKENEVTIGPILDRIVESAEQVAENTTSVFLSKLRAERKAKQDQCVKEVAQKKEEVLAKFQHSMTNKKIRVKQWIEKETKLIKQVESEGKKGRYKNICHCQIDHENVSIISCFQRFENCQCG